MRPVGDVPSHPKTQRTIWNGPALWLSLAGTAMYGAVYIWHFAEGDNPRISLVFVLLALVFAATGIARSRRAPAAGEVCSERSPWMSKVLLAAVIIHVVIAVAMVRQCPGKVIDVFTVETSAADALLHGIDPYTITQENIYNDRDSARFYGPGAHAKARLDYGYPYPPLQLLLVIPGFLLGDVRYSSIAVIVITALLMARLRNSWLSVAISCLLLLNPLTFMMIRFSWTDPFVLMLLTTTVYAAVKRKWWLPIALGLFLCSKQYAVLAIPFVLLLRDSWRSSLKLLAQAVGVAAVVTLPFAFWNLPHFLHDIQGPLHAPFRTDSLSLAVRLGHPIPMEVNLALVAIATLAVLLFARRTPAIFAASYGFALLIIFCIGRQGFANYYFLIAQSLWLGAAASAASTTLPGAFRGIGEELQEAAALR
jgi:hypothetical protein